MLKRRILLLIISFAALCLRAAPVRADLFHFTVHRLDMTYDGTDFDASLNSTLGAWAFTRDMPTIGTTLFGPGFGDFNISMNISDIDNVLLTADGVGDFTLTDTDGDTITGTVAGQWGVLGVPIFAGRLSNVLWNNESTDNTFEGETDPVSMIFTAPQPWSGTLIELTASGATWFGDGAWSGTVTGGSVGASVVPTPAAVLLGMLGLGAAGLGLRRFA